jgi:hypothetical protein
MKVEIDEGFNARRSQHRSIRIVVRMWRVSGVIRLWHVQRDAFKNLGDPPQFLQSR